MLALLLLASPARAFVCTRANSSSSTQGSLQDGPSLSWMGTRTLPYTIQSDGTAQILPFSQTVSILQQAFSVWQTPTLSPNEAARCGSPNNRSDIQFVATQNSPVTWVGYDFLQPNSNVNLLVFRDKVWPNGPGAVDIIALTTTTFSALTGEILDADIEFDSATYHFVADNPGPTDMDLLNAAVHEVGHFLGLAHCVSDPNGTCGHDEVMEPSSSFGETKKRTLKCDDLAGLVYKYPPGGPNGYCDPNNLTPTCGFCLPPNVANETPIITEVDHGTGRAGCQAGAALPLWLPAALVGASRRRRRWLRVAAAAAVFGASGCSTAECDGTTPPLDPLAPVILHMELAGQVPSDPWRVILATDFADFDGDLGN
jgi:hypothetical protein